MLCPVVFEEEEELETATSGVAGDEDVAVSTEGGEDALQELPDGMVGGVGWVGVVGGDGVGMGDDTHNGIQNPLLPVPLLKINMWSLHCICNKQGWSVKHTADVRSPHMPICALGPIARKHHLLPATSDRPDGPPHIMPRGEGCENKWVPSVSGDGVPLQVPKGCDAVKRIVNIIKGDGVDVATCFLACKGIVEVELAHALHW